MDNMVAKVQVQTETTVLLKLEVFNLVMELVVRKVTADRNDKLQYTPICR
jgi:hypothetical protein